jgi:hypothetical protein
LYKKQYQSNRQKIDAQDDSEDMLSDVEKEKQSKLEEEALHQEYLKSPLHAIFGSMGSPLTGSYDGLGETLFNIG